MAKFVKEILRPGSYYVNVVGGRRRKETFTKERLANFVKQHEEMVKAGLKIPAPWKHALEALPASASPGDKPLHPGDTFSSSKDNAGFWGKLFQDKRGVLYGELDVANQADADKIGTSVQEVSPYVKTEFEDGLQRKWQDSVLHIALVTNPVMPGQQNFERLPTPAAATAPGSPAVSAEHGIALSLSNFLAPPNVDIPDSVLLSMDQDEATDTPDEEMPEETPVDSPNPGQTSASGASIQDALNALREIGLDLPEDTHEGNLVERIVVASRAISTATGGGSNQPDPNDPNAQHQEMPTPIAMSLGNGTMPNTNLTVDDRVAAFAVRQARKSYDARIDQLIASGRISAAYRDAHLKPLMEGFQLSLDEAGAATPTAIDHLLDALEAIPASSTLNGGTVTTRKDGKVNVKKEGRTIALSLAEEPLPAEYEGDTNEVTDADADRVVEELFRNTGRYVAPAE